MFLNERCYICNHVNTELIETNAGEALKKNFLRDSQDDKRMICEECKSAHEELMLEYESQDDIYSWKIEVPYVNDNTPSEDILLVELGETFYTNQDEIQDQDIEA